MTPEPTPATNPAPPSVRPGLLDANLFTIERPARISYSRSSITGRPLFDYQDVTFDLNFQGDEIERTTTPLGELVTVVLENVADAFVRTLTLVVPRVRLSRGDAAEFQTLVVETIDRSGAFVPAPGPQGVLTTYQIHEVTGTAQLVDF